MKPLLTLAVQLFAFSILSLLNSIAYAVTYTQQTADNTSRTPITVAHINLQQQALQLFLNNQQGQPFKRLNSLASHIKQQGHTLEFAMNAGMYHADFSPVGLLVINAKIITPLNTASGFGNFYLKPNGVFFITQQGASILETSNYAKQQPPAILATQSGPMLILNGKVNPAFSATSTSALIRNGVCVRHTKQVLFAISNTPINFYDFAQFFAKKLGCNNALYLDGTVSSLYAPRLKRYDTKVDLGPMIGVVQ